MRSGRKNAIPSLENPQDREALLKMLQMPGGGGGRKNAISIENPQDREQLVKILLQKMGGGGRSRKQKEQQPTTPRSSSIPKLPKLTKQQQQQPQQQQFQQLNKLWARTTVGGLRKRQELGLPDRFIPAWSPLPVAGQGTSKYGGVTGLLDSDFYRQQRKPPTRFSPVLKGVSHYQTGGAQEGRRPIKVFPQVPPSRAGGGSGLSFPASAGFHTFRDDLKNISSTDKPKKDKKTLPPPPPKAKGKKQFFPEGKKK